MSSAKGLFMAKTGDRAEVLLYDQIGLDPWTGEGITAKKFAAQLKALGDVKAIDLKINSPGGDVFDGLAIYNELKDHQAAVSVRVMGLAASAASIVAMAGDTIEMQANAQMMVHKAWAFTIGNADDMAKMADTLNGIDESLVGTYAKRTKQDEKKIRQMLADETWLGADEAVSLGFADSVVEAKDSPRAEFRLMACFRNAPKRPHGESPIEGEVAYLRDRIEMLRG